MSRRPWLALAAGAAAGLVAFGALFAFFRPRTPAEAPGRVVRFEMPPPSGRTFFTTVEAMELAVSPDGSRIAFVVTERPRGVANASDSAALQTGRQVWIRDLASTEPRLLAGTQGASSLFWSPDGRSLGFFTPDKLKRVDVTGGSPVTICDVPPGAGKAGSWGARGDILMTNVQAAAISRVPASGGSPVTVLDASPDRGEIRLNWPWYLPDGKRFLYWARLRDRSTRIMLGEEGKPPREILAGSSGAQYREPGYLLYAREGALFAQKLDADRGALVGEPVSVADRVSHFETSGHASFAVSLSGTLVFQSHESISRILSFDRSGRELVAFGKPGGHLSLSISRDGRRIFFDQILAGAGSWDVWSYDVERGVESRITSTPDTEIAPIELPDRKNLVYSASRQGQPQLQRLETATGTERPLAPGPGTFQLAEDVSPGGETLVYVERTPRSPFDIWTLRLDGDATPTPVLKSPFGKLSVRFSPDGKYLAFISDESGRDEAYVVPFPGPGVRTQVSAGGASLVRWSRDGRELNVVSADRKLVSVPVRTAPALWLGTPSVLFPIPGRVGWTSFDLFPDGKRILAIVTEILAGEQPMTVVVDPRLDLAPAAPRPGP